MPGVGCRGDLSVGGQRHRVAVSDVRRRTTRCSGLGGLQGFRIRVLVFKVLQSQPHFIGLRFKVRFKVSDTMNLKLKDLLAANSPSFVLFPHGAQAVSSCPRSWVARPSGRDVPSNDPPRALVTGCQRPHVSSHTADLCETSVHVRRPKRPRTTPQEVLLGASGTIFR